MATTKSFSLYLAKQPVLKEEDLLTDKARELIRAKTAYRSASKTFGDGAVLFTFPGHADPPSWVKMVKSSFAIPDQLNAQSPSAILVFKKGKNSFAMTFSFGHVYLDDAKTEADFGLRVSINALTDGKLKSVERANIGAAIRDHAQAAGQRDLRTFGFNDALDLIRKVSGKASDDEEFADVVTGARSLRFTKKIELIEVPEAALSAVELFNSTAYRKTAFRIIDFLSPVLDTTLQEQLDSSLVTSIKEASDDFEIGIPEVMPTDVGTFRFELAGISEFHADLSLKLYQEGLGDRLSELHVDDLKRHRIAAYTTSDDKCVAHWSVRDSLVGSLIHHKERYALNEGLWYRVGQAYKKSAEDKFEAILSKPDKKMRALKKKVMPKEKGKKAKIGFQSEESYNEEIAAETGYLLMDQKLIQIDEVPGPGVEACDLLDIPGRRFIHVKKSSRQSSVLSHFFKQGGNAAQMLKKYEPFKASLIAKIKALHGSARAQEFEKSLKDKWTIEFHIADYPRKNGEFNIPFFSKLSLRDEALDLEAMDFDVAVRFIKLPDAR